MIPLPLVTVYITNHNYGRYLRRAIESVLSQSLSSFELLIIDDGSTDDSRQILREYEGHENVYVVLQDNKGLNASNNVALKLARGKYLMRLDADDYLDPHALEVMSGTLEREPDCALVFPDYYLVSEEGEIITQVRRHDFRDVTLLDQPAHGACTMFRVEALRAVGGYDEAVSCQDGYDIWLSITARYPVRNVNLPLFFYRQHGSSLTRDSGRILNARATIKEHHVGRRGLPRQSVAAVVPVRGQAMDPRSRPLAELGGRRLIDWTLELALSCDLLDSVIVTTPDPEVEAYVSDRYGPRVLLAPRPRESARINVAVGQTLLEGSRAEGAPEQPPDSIMALFVEWPFRRLQLLQEVIHTMQLYDVDVVDTVVQDDGFFYRHRGKGLQPLDSADGLRLERDDLYRRAGGLYLVRRSHLERQGAIHAGRTGHVICDDRSTFSIQRPLDWKIAELIAAEVVPA